MIRARDLVRALREHDLADWVIVERDQRSATADDAGLRRTERRVRWQLTVHHDAAAGRGSAHVELDAAGTNPDAAVWQAVTLAQSSVGPPWETQPPAAPARVQLEDPSLSMRDPLDVAVEIVRGAARPTGATVHASGEYLREQVFAQSRQGLRTSWVATLVRGDAIVSIGEHSLAVTRQARRYDDLGMTPALARAAADLKELATARSAQPGACRLVLRADAMLHGGLGVWAAFVPQADAVHERQGLTRYRERTPIVPGAELIAEPLTITSDGALDHGLYSAPLGDHGDAVRRFSLVERGIAAGLGLSPREAALRGRDPNGGVRNLVVATGTWAGTIEPGDVRVLEVKRLRDLSIDRYTGDASLELALAVEHGAGAPVVVTGGSLRLDLIAALARARRSKAELRRGGYVGPDAILIDTAELR